MLSNHRCCLIAAPMHPSHLHGRLRQGAAEEPRGKVECRVFGGTPLTQGLCGPQPEDKDRKPRARALESIRQSWAWGTDRKVGGEDQEGKRARGRVSTYMQEREHGDWSVHHLPGT